MLYSLINYSTTHLIHLKTFMKKEMTRPDISGLPELRETSWLANEVLKDLRISEEKQKNYVVNYVAGFMRTTAILQKQMVLPTTDSGLGSGCDLPCPNKKISRKSLSVEATQSKIESFTTRLAHANIDVKCDRFSNENRRKILSGRLSDGLNVEFSKTKLAKLMLKSGMKDTMFDYRIKKVIFFLKNIIRIKKNLVRLRRCETKYNRSIQNFETSC